MTMKFWAATVPAVSDLGRLHERVHRFQHLITGAERSHAGTTRRLPPDRRGHAHLQREPAPRRHSAPSLMVEASQCRMHLLSSAGNDTFS